MIQAVDHVPADCTVVVARAKGYDFELDKKIWTMPMNRNKSRDLVCAGCKNQIVMSNWMFSRYQKKEFGPEAIICLDCLRMNYGRPQVVHHKGAVGTD